MSRASDIYEPTKADIQQVIDDVIETAEHAIDPMYPINALGAPYWVDLGDGLDTSNYPWQDGIGTLFVANDDGRIHWMHPDIRIALDQITEPMLCEALERGNRFTKGKSPQEIAHIFYQWCRSSLETLDERLTHTGPFHAAVVRIGRHPTAAEASQSFADLCREHGLDRALGEDIAKCALKLDLGEYVGTTFDRAAARAALLSRMIDPKLCPAPLLSTARDALSRLHLADADEAASVDIACVAEATAHRLLPENLIAERYTEHGAANLLRLQIENGAFDPKDGDDKPIRGMQERIGEILTGGDHCASPISAHLSLPIIAAANARLEALGLPPVTPASCREAAKRLEMIPF